jgi:hypothetical protein
LLILSKVARIEKKQKEKPAYPHGQAGFFQNENKNSSTILLFPHTLNSHYLHRDSSQQHQYELQSSFSETI